MAVPAAGVWGFRSRVWLRCWWVPRGGAGPVPAGACRLGGLGRWRCVAPEYLPVGADGFDGSVGQEFGFPSLPVDADVVVVLAEKGALLGGGGGAVFAVLRMMHIALGGGPVAAGPGAVPVAEDDGTADGLGNVIGDADVQGKTPGVIRGGEQPGPQHRGQDAGPGQEPHRQPSP